MYNDTTTSYNIEKLEYAYNTEMANYSAPPTIQMYIPKLMANIGMGTPTTFTGSINGSIFANDASCKPSPPGTVTLQNYITVPKWDNESPEFPDKTAEPIPFPRMFRFQKFIVEILNGDIRNIHYTGRI